MSDLRRLPSVDALSRELGLEFPNVASGRLVEVIRSAQAKVRVGKMAIEELVPAIRADLNRLLNPSLRRVINATGVVLHTNLGRAPLPEFEPIPGYQNLEYDLTTGKRGRRDEHTSSILEALLGARAILVNNNAAATFLVLRAVADGGEVLVSRGELVEIGDGFRIPEIMEQSGVKLREIGATNRTRLDDYRSAITPNTKMLMRVHPSNFHISGFAGKPSLEDLAEVAQERSLPFYEDLGSGCLVDLRPYGVQEPLVRESLAAGVDIVSFSTDKLLGGPQAGIIAGKPELVERVRRHPLYRAFRVDKLTIQVLESTFRHLWSGQFHLIPSLRFISTPLEELERRIRAVRENAGTGAVEAGESLLGGGSTPDQSLRTWLLTFSTAPERLERQLRENEPPIIARIERGKLLIDLRSVEPSDDECVANALRRYARST